MNTGICEVVVTAGDAEALVKLTRTLVDERLAACGQTIASIRSIYRWDGAVQDDPEEWDWLAPEWVSDYLAHYRPSTPLPWELVQPRGPAPVREFLH